MMANQYRKKPVVIEAVEWTGENLLEMIDFMDHCVSLDGMISISTLEGVMKAGIGDYIIKGIQGEFYPCKPDIFKQTYELVE